MPYETHFITFTAKSKAISPESFSLKLSTAGTLRTFLRQNYYDSRIRGRLALLLRRARHAYCRWEHIHHFPPICRDVCGAAAASAAYVTQFAGGNAAFTAHPTGSGTSALSAAVQKLKRTGGKPPVPEISFSVCFTAAGLLPQVPCLPRCLRTS